MTDLTTKTPKEIDTEIARLSEKISRADFEYRSLSSHMERENDRHEALKKKAYERDGDWPLADFYADTFHGKQNAERLAEITERILRLHDETEPFQAEYVRRGRWNRYFLVTNSNGHVHRGMDCSTCFPDTRYAWLVDLADCDEAAMVEEYGTKACTVCFPNAPTLPAWKRAEEIDAAAKAEKDAKVCPGSGRCSGAWYGHERCEVCGDLVRVTKNGNYRKHNRRS